MVLRKLSELACVSESLSLPYDVSLSFRKPIEIETPNIMFLSIGKNLFLMQMWFF